MSIKKYLFYMKNGSGTQHCLAVAVEVQLVCVVSHLCEQHMPGVFF